jgi:tyrosyl-tRNA synthetase
MYGKLMSVSDELMWRYWTLLTDLRGSEIAQMQTDVVGGALHPMQAKKNLAWTITRDFHSKEEADAAADGWAKMFQQRGVSEDVPVVKVALNDPALVAYEQPATALEGPPVPVIRIARLIQTAGLASSTGEASRKIAENAVSINGHKFSGKVERLDRIQEGLILRLGKKSVRVEWVD